MASPSQNSKNVWQLVWVEIIHTGFCTGFRTGIHKRIQKTIRKCVASFDRVSTASYGKQPLDAPALKSSRDLFCAVSTVPKTQSAFKRNIERVERSPKAVNIGKQIRLAGPFPLVLAENKGDIFMNEETASTSSADLVNLYLSPVRQYFEDPLVTEIMINTYDQIFVERQGLIERVDAQFDNEEAVQILIHMIATNTGQSADALNHPIIDARLPDGSRVCGVLNPWSAAGSSLSIRLFPKTVLTAEDLLRTGSFTDEMLEFLRLAIQSRANVLVSGSTGSGKTTLLNVLTSFIPSHERVVTVEDTEELNVGVTNSVRLVSANRKKDTQDAQDTSMPSFIKTALRQNPDRIIVGEMRDKDAADAFLQAINTGHNGCASTLHANSCNDALIRLQNFLGASGLPVAYVESQVRSNLHLLIQAEKVPGVGRLISSITEVRETKTLELWGYDYLVRRHIKNEEAFADSLILKLATRHGFR